MKSRKSLRLGDTAISSRRVRQPGQLSRADAERLARISREYTEKVNRHRLNWGNLEDEDDIFIVADGIVTTPTKLPSLQEFSRRQRKNRSGKGKGKGKGKSNAQKLPSAQVVLTEVQNALSSLPIAGMKGNLQLLEFNAEFLDLAKAKYFADVYKEIVKHGHVIFLEEINAAAVSHLASITGYIGYCCKSNSRGQAVAFLIHSRLKVIGGPTEYTQVANVFGIPDLRPAYELELEDTVTGLKFKVVVVHQKSMRGGPKSTGQVRYKQNDVLQQVLGASFEGVVAGDWNCFLSDPNVTDCDPLKNNGFKLVYPNDTTSTQSMGGRLDGYFIKGLKVKVGMYKIYNFWRNPKITRAFSDHGLLRVLVIQCDSKAQADPTKPNEGCNATGGNSADADDETGEVEASVGNTAKQVDAELLQTRDTSDSNAGVSKSQDGLKGGLEPIIVEGEDLVSSRRVDKARRRSQSRLGNSGLKRLTKSQGRSTKTPATKTRSAKTKSIKTAVPKKRQTRRTKNGGGCGCGG